MPYDDAEDHYNDDDDEVNFQVRTSRLCIEVGLDKIYNMMMLKIMIMILMMMIMVKMIIAVT